MFSDKMLFHDKPFPMAVPFISLLFIQKGAINVIFTFCNDRLTCWLCCLHVWSLVWYFLLFSPFLYLSDLVSSQQLLCLSACVLVSLLCLSAFATTVFMHLVKPRTFFTLFVCQEISLSMPTKKNLTAEANMSLQNQNHSVTTYSWKDYLKVFTCRGLKTPHLNYRNNCMYWEWGAFAF